MLDTPLAKAIYQGVMQGLGLSDVTVEEKHGVTKTSSTIKGIKPIKVTSLKLTGPVELKYNNHSHKFFAQVGDKTLVNKRRRDLVRTLSKHGVVFYSNCNHIKDNR
jgi:hypothetical protein